MFRRMVLGISPWYFATLIEKSESFVYKIEDTNVQAQYNVHDYPILANALNWTVEDLLPPDDWDVGDGTKVEKIVLSLANPEDVRLVLEGMIEDGFFNKPKTLVEVVKHLYIDREGKKKEREVLEQVLGELVNDSKLKIEDGMYFLE